MLIWTRRGQIDFYDEHDYDRLAEALASGKGFAGMYGPTAFRPPGQPAFMALIYAAVGHSPTAVLVVQAVLLTLLPFLIARLSRLISRHPAIPNGAAALAALHPALIYSSASLYPVTLTALLLAAAILASLELLDGGKLRWAAAAGLSLAALTLTTPYFAPLIAVVLALLLRRRQVRASALLAVLAFAPLGGWMARNARVIGEPALTTSGGFNLALGANDLATPRSGNLIEPPLASIPDDEVERDRAYQRAARAWIVAHPARYAALVAGRAVCVLDSVGRPATRGLHDGLLAHLAGWALLPGVLLGLAGLWLERKRLVSVLVAAALGAVVLASAATLVKPRFRFPCDPLLAPFAMVAVTRLWRRETSGPVGEKVARSQETAPAPPPPP